MSALIPFEVSPHILTTVVRKHASTLDRAIAEAVMNSDDAHATRVTITADEQGVSSGDQRGEVDNAVSKKHKLSEARFD